MPPLLTGRNHHSVGMGVITEPRDGRAGLQLGAPQHLHWPNGFAAKGEVRAQFHHVIDVAPTVLEAAGLPEPTVVDGVAQRPIGVSTAYSFDGAESPDRHDTQYFEMFCSRGIYHQGWRAVTGTARRG